jgi:hypothetical protein
MRESRLSKERIIAILKAASGGSAGRISVGAWDQFRSPGALAAAPFCLTLVLKIAVATASHDVLRARQLHVGTKTIRHPKIRARRSLVRTGSY